MGAAFTCFETVMILGTAGHIDHGKTSLVKALTGVDTDRLPEEKKRGITIELGFAPLELEGVGTLGVVDVPGHEAFVRNMLAGATGIDLALVVVAADEGVMPQTREHLSILSLLNVRNGVVAITKADLVESDWLELVVEDVRALLEETSLAGAPIVPVSVVSRSGLDELRAELRAAAAAVPARGTDDFFRMPVDRVFTIRGTGTVVTGTVWSGTLRRESNVRVFPYARTLRVRDIQTHGHTTDVALPGNRTAIALAAVEVEEIARGSTIVGGDAWEPTDLLLAEITLLPDTQQTLGPRTRVRFHLGAAEVGARIVIGRDVQDAGEIALPARVFLDEPVIARSGDRFVIRGGSPLTTLGGGIVTDPLPAHRRTRPGKIQQAGPADRLRMLAEEAGAQGVTARSLPIRLGVAPATIDKLIGENPDLFVIAGNVFTASATMELAKRIEDVVTSYHGSHPLDPGVSLQSVRTELGVAPELVDKVVDELVRRGTLVIDRSLVRRTGWEPTLSAQQAELAKRIAHDICTAGAEPPMLSELTASYGGDVPALLRHLERGGVVTQVSSEFYYDVQVLDSILERIRRSLKPGVEYGPGDFRDVLDLSRKYLIPLLEYCDRRGITERRSTGRVLRQTGPRAAGAG
jgi:selenocysteine-specific elongation factor